MSTLKLIKSEKLVGRISNLSTMADQNRLSPVTSRSTPAPTSSKKTEVPSTSSASANPALPTFLVLPAEIRRLIYKLILSPPFRVSKASKEDEFFNIEDYLNIRDHRPQFTELLEVCRQIRDEAARVLYQSVYSLHWQDVQTLYSHQNQHLKWIQTLAVDFFEFPLEIGLRATGPKVPRMDSIEWLTRFPALQRCVLIMRAEFLAHRQTLWYLGIHRGISWLSLQLARAALCLTPFHSQKRLNFDLWLLFAYKEEDGMDFVVHYQTDILGKSKEQIQELAIRLLAAQDTSLGRHNAMNAQPEWVKEFRPIHSLKERAQRNIQPTAPLGSAYHPIVLD